MKSSALLTPLVLTASALLLSGCMHHHGYEDRYPDANAATHRGYMHHDNPRNQAAMCEEYSKMTPEERRARMTAHHGQMSQEMLQQHERRLQEGCALKN